MFKNGLQFNKSAGSIGLPAKVEIVNHNDGYSTYSILDNAGRVLFKSSGPSYIIRDLAEGQRKRLLEGE
jgi:hypothetical protein